MRRNPVRGALAKQPRRPTTEQSRVKQSFSHGRTKTVILETKRKAPGDTNLLGSKAVSGAAEVAAPATPPHHQAIVPALFYAP
jgi:translation initiation factor IF-2